jgi:hypothetical protein
MAGLRLLSGLLSLWFAGFGVTELRHLDPVSAVWRRIGSWSL